jgi:hypothetical protein
VTLSLAKSPGAPYQRQQEIWYSDAALSKSPCAVRSRRNSLLQSSAPSLFETHVAYRLSVDEISLTTELWESTADWHDCARADEPQAAFALATRIAIVLIQRIIVRVP